MMLQFVTSSYCLKCLGCCRFYKKISGWSPHLSDKDIENLLKNNIAPSLISSHKTIKLKAIQEQAIFICPFFSLKNNRCKIYKIRPFECKLYPFLINKSGKNVFLAIDISCRYIAENLKSKKFEQYINYLTKLVSGQKFKSFLKNNPQLIHRYKNVLNLRSLYLNR